MLFIFPSWANSSPYISIWISSLSNTPWITSSAVFIVVLNIVENKVEDLDEIIEEAYKLAKERDLKNVGKKYKDYYEYILNNGTKKELAQWNN